MIKLVLLVYMAVICLVRCQRDDLYRELKKKANMITSILPDNPSQPVNVSIGFTISYIVDMNNDRQVLELNGWMEMQWKEQRLGWNPQEYGDIGQMRLQNGDLPIPDIKLFNGQINVDAENTLVMLTNDGTVSYIPPVTTKSFCSAEPSSDVFICTLKFGSWTHHCDDMPIESRGADPSNFFGGWRWNMLNITSKIERTYYTCCPEAYCTWNVSFKFKDNSRSKNN